MGRRQWDQYVVTAITLAVGAVPALYIGWFVARYGVEVPLLDDWEMAPLITKSHTGGVTFADFFKQEQEARMIVPKVIFILSAIGGRWDVRDQMMVSVVVAAVTALGIYLLLRRTKLSAASTSVCFWLISLLIFTPAQWELWLFASGFPSFMPALFLVAAWLVLRSNASVAAKFGSCALLAAMSSFTLAHGVLAWLLTFPVYLLGNRVPRWKQWLIGWLALSALCGLWYLSDYTKPEHLPNLAPALSPWEYVRFLLMFLGGAFAYATDGDRAGAALAVGAAALALFLPLIAWVSLNRHDRELMRRLLPWIALGFYALGSAALATLGRVGFGADYAISPRYVTFSLYFFVAIIVLGTIALREIGTHGATARVSTTVVMVAVLAVVGVLFTSTFATSVLVLHSLSARNRLARSAITFSPVLDTSALIRRIVYPAPQLAMQRADQLDKAKLIRPALVRSNRISDLRHGRADERAASGWSDALAVNPDGTYHVFGWAALPNKNRPADAVVLAYSDPAGRWIIFGMSDTIVRRPDVATRFGTDDQLWSGWSANFAATAVPVGSQLSAWAVDGDGPKLYRLKDNTRGIDSVRRTASE